MLHKANAAKYKRLTKIKLSVAFLSAPPYNLYDVSDGNKNEKANTKKGE